MDSTLVERQRNPKIVIGAYSSSAPPLPVNVPPSGDGHDTSA